MGDQSKKELAKESGEEGQLGEKDENHGGHGGHDSVTITVNNLQHQIHRGRRTVGEIKRAGQVPQADELAQVFEGATPPLTPLPDDGTVVIKGGEVFVSYPKDSGSSHDVERDHSLAVPTPA